MRLRALAAFAGLASLAPFVLASAAWPAAAQQAGAGQLTAGRRPIVPEDLYRLKTVGDVVVSPDGRRVAYVVVTVDSARDGYQRDLWIVASDGSSERRLTWDGSAGSPAFSPDSRLLAFVARREGDVKPQIYVLPLAEGGEAWRLTSLSDGAGDPVWSPDGKRIAFASQLSNGGMEHWFGFKARDEQPQPRGDSARAARLAAAAAEGDPRVVTRLGFLAETGLAPEQCGEIFLAEVARGGKVWPLTSDPCWPHSSPAWSPDGKTIAYVARPPKGRYEPDVEEDADIWVMASDGTGAPRNLTGGDRPPDRVKPLPLPGPGRVAAWSESEPAFSPDGQWIAYVRTVVGEGGTAANSEVVQKNLVSGAVVCTSCRMLRSARRPLWSGDARRPYLYYTLADQGDALLMRTDRPDRPGTQVMRGPGGVTGFDAAGGTVAWGWMSPADPSELYAARADGSAPRRLTRLNDDFLAGVQVQPYEAMWYHASDGTRIQGWVVRPADFRGGMPLAVEMHGGPHVMWGPGEASMWLEYESLAGDGYVVFFANPRGSDGYGQEWKQAIHRNWGELAMGDVLAGADSVIARGWADRERQYLTGGSYAGFLTAWMVGHTDRFKAAAAQRGVYDMATWYGTANTWRLFEGEFDAVPWEQPDLAWKASPLAYVENIHTPLLILHGEEDRRVGMGGAEMMYRALKVLGREVEFVRYPREGHELTRSGEPAHRVDHMNRILDWFDRHSSAATSARAADTQR